MIRLCTTFILLGLSINKVLSQPIYPLKDSIQKVVTELNSGKTSIDGYQLISPEEVVRLYDQNSFSPLWWWNDNLATQVDEAVKLLLTSYREGLFPKDYHYDELIDIIKSIRQNKSGKISDRIKVQFEFLLTDGLLTYARHVYGGKVDHECLNAVWDADCKELEINYSTYVLDAFRHFSLTESFEKLKPTNEGYIKLKHALQYYRHLAASHSNAEMLDPSSTMDNTFILNDLWTNQKLIVNGDLKEENFHNSDSIEVAVVKFKNRHGLEENHDLDTATINELNKSLNARINSIIANLERWRWLPTHLEDKYMIVNIANFDLKVIVNGKTAWGNNVIVGQHYRQTPVLSAKILGVTINPDWTVPPTILKEDILPKGKQIPSYLRKNNIEVLDHQGKLVNPDSVQWQSLNGKYFPYILRQKPGAFNALGKIKFIMPNSHFVYLHDTPTKGLFKRSERTFSSGCIRVAQPYLLAQFLFEADQNMNDKRLYKLRDEEITQDLWLKEPWKIHILYWTSWVDEVETVNFRKDIYHRDARLIKMLKSPPLPYCSI
jgi:L,D-transpeptidase YcbB